MVAGPWFTVRDSEAGTWQDFGDVWWSDGRSDGKATLQLRLKLEEPQEVARVD